MSPVGHADARRASREHGLSGGLFLCILGKNREAAEISSLIKGDNNLDESTGFNLV